jgi:predicted dehydrogenase
VSHSLPARLGRRVRLGIIGGGLDSVIGSSHLVALRADGLADIVAGAMSIDPVVADQSAAELLVAQDRRYATWQDMLAAERSRDDGIDAVVVITPPRFHAEIAIAYLGAGIHVLSEKPLTATAQQAIALVEAVENSSAIFAVTHCYTGYPLVREARELVRAGAIGRVTLIDGQLAAGDPGVLREPADPARRHWNLRPESMGKAVVLGEVGSHAHHIVEYVTGQRVVEVSAQLATLAENRDVYDNAYLTLSFDGGAKGRLWASYVAAGNEHGLQFTIFGNEGSLHWDQEDPEHLWLSRAGEPRQRLSRGLDGTTEAAKAASRLRPGHPEGYLMAFATIYRDFFTGVLLTLLGEDATEALAQLPTVQQAARTIRLMDVAIESHDSGGPVAFED